MRDAAYDEFIDRLRVASDVVSIISEYVPLKKRGRNYWGCCPFHGERTPSFSVNPDKGFFYCFGCQAGGNIFNFLMKIENLSFFESVKLLANKLDIPLPERERSAQDRQRERELAELYRVNALARDFFHACLTKTGYGKAAREYLAARGVTDKAVADFQLGFAPPAWDKLSTALKERGFTPEMLVKAGLAVPRQNGNGNYDRFRDRIMFPIVDPQGRVVGFGGRVLDGSQPKYLNSPETVVFNKRHILYGLDKAYQHIRQTGKAVVVEGYMDLIAAHTNGITNTIASLGTAFTPEQARKLTRYHVSEVYFAYDSDAAGQEATLRALATIKAFGLDIRVVTIPEGKDPDELIRRQGADAFAAIIEKAPSLLEYQIHRALQSADYSDFRGKAAVLSMAVPALAQAQENTRSIPEVNEFIRQLSEQLAIHENDIRNEIRKYLAANKKDKNVSNGKTINMTALSRNIPTATVAAERQIIRLMLEDNSIIPYVQAQMDSDYIQGGSRKIIIKSLFEAYNMGKSLAPEMFALDLPAEAGSELSNIMVMEMQVDDITRVVDDYLKIIRMAYLKVLYEQHRLKADELQRMGDSSYLQELAESQRIKDEINKLHHS